jgi:hypothetical protein
MDWFNQKTSKNALAVTKKELKASQDANFILDKKNKIQSELISALESGDIERVRILVC